MNMNKVSNKFITICDNNFKIDSQEDYGLDLVFEPLWYTLILYNDKSYNNSCYNNRGNL